MNILNIGINNTANIYIDSLKENNSRIKNFYVTLNKEEYKYSNSINSFNYTSPVSTHTGKFYNFLTQLPKPV